MPASSHIKTGYIRGLYRGFYKDNGKENGSYYITRMLLTRIVLEDFTVLSPCCLCFLAQRHFCSQTDAALSTAENTGAGGAREEPPAGSGDEGLLWSPDCSFWGCPCCSPPRVLLTGRYAWKAPLMEEQIHEQREEAGISSFTGLRR